MYDQLPDAIADIQSIRTFQKEFTDHGGFAFHKNNKKGGLDVSYKGVDLPGYAAKFAKELSEAEAKFSALDPEKDLPQKDVESEDMYKDELFGEFAQVLTKAKEDQVRLEASIKKEKTSNGNKR